MIESMKEAKKVVKQRFPFAVAVKLDPFYGWAVLVSSKANVCVVQKQRDEETAWIAAASELKRWMI